MPGRLNLEALVQDAQGCRSPSELHEVLMKAVGGQVGFDTAIFVPLWPRPALPTAIDKPDHLKYFQLFVANRDHYAPSLRKATACSATLHAYIDTEIYTAAERERLPFFADIIRPQRIGSQLVLYPRVFGRPVASVHLERYGRSRFRPKDIERVGRLIPLIGMAQAAFAACAPKGDESLKRRLERLAPRERQIAALVAQGLRNRDIASQLGLSSNSVRNRLAQIFDKLGASSRTELAVWLEGAGVVESWSPR